ncbi:unnamed protein product [Cylicocyclus nassatus]|uniref:Uncharacterized protein n=1 Tax=Cylicocyclus nassatus TaxID=53992 RepID=A0AA36HG94_CYLNA|nr:unnamed protein product [Cylicocyclus nassatus]
MDGADSSEQSIPPMKRFKRDELADPTNPEPSLVVHVRNLNPRSGIHSVSRSTGATSSGSDWYQVKIMLHHDPRGQMGPKNAPPDHVQILKQMPEVNPTEPSSEHKLEKRDVIPIVPPPMQPVEVTSAY